MLNLKTMIVLIAICCMPLAACVTFPELNSSGQSYEKDVAYPTAYERIHDNMDTTTYNQSAGALARGNKRKFKAGLQRLENSNSQFNRQNAGVLRAVATCAKSPANSTTTTSPCAPK